MAAILADHENGPAQFVLHLLVALFDAVAQAIEPHNFGHGTYLRGKLALRYLDEFLSSLIPSVASQTARRRLPGP